MSRVNIATKPAVHLSIQLRLRPNVNPICMTVRNMANHRHKKIIKLAKGYRGRGKNCYSIAYRRVLKARQYAYRDRKVKKREFRKLWIQRINAASRIHGLPYNNLIHNMSKANVILDRKVLSEMAITEPWSFRAVVEATR
jgi:large subunit ribosomal protein L20